jgi:hypothetical protein
LSTIGRIEVGDFGGDGDVDAFGQDIIDKRPHQ